MARKYLKILLFVLATLSVAGAVFSLGRKPPLDVIHPVRGPAVQAVYATGTVEPIVMVPLAPRTAGRVTELLADEGEQVAKGQVLARLEDQNLQKSLAEARARAELAQKEYERQAELLKRGVTTKKATDQSLADRDAARATMERIEAELDFLQLTAPEAGKIIRRDGEVGEMIPAGDPVFWLSCCSGLRIEAEVDEEDIALIKKGQKVVIRADAFPDEIFEGTLESITPKGDPVSRSYRVRIVIAPDTKLMIGMTAETNIVIREDKNALLIPASALTDENKVMIAAGGLIKEAGVAIGARTPDVVEIREGLGEGDLIVRDAMQAPLAGSAVETRLKEWKAP